MRWSLGLAALNGLLSVATGAFAAHGAAPAAKAWLETGAHYQGVHAAAALAAASLLARSRRLGGAAVWLFGVGGLVFAGSLDLLAVTGVRAWGALTPLGGLMLIAGWLALLVVLVREGPR